MSAKTVGTSIIVCGALALLPAGCGGTEELEPSQLSQPKLPGVLSVASVIWYWSPAVNDSADWP